MRAALITLAVLAAAAAIVQANELDDLERAYKAQKLKLLAKQRSTRAIDTASISTKDGAVTVTAKDFVVSDGTDSVKFSELGLQKDIEALAGSTTRTIDALVNNVTALDERSRRMQAEIGGSLKKQLDDLATGQTKQSSIVNSKVAGVDVKVDKVLGDVKDLGVQVGNEASLLLKTVSTSKSVAAAFVALKDFMKKNAVCAVRGMTYDEKAKKCACEAGFVYSSSKRSCIQKPGTKDVPAKDCMHAMTLWPEATDGKYWVKPGSKAFEAYCDMTTDGGGWTLIESYHLVTHKQSYKQKPFSSQNFPRNAAKPPASASEKDGGWKDHRLGKTEIDALMDRSSQVHARCNRNFAKSQKDYLFADITAIMFYYSNMKTKPFGNKFMTLHTRGMIRGYTIEARNLAWYNDKAWHPGFDVSGNQIPSSTSSEDSFTWHDGGLSKHQCHQKEGDTVWMVRGGGNVGTKDAPAMSCNHALHVNKKLKNRNGPYYLKLASSSTPKRVFCDMTNHGGGWTLFGKYNRGMQLYNLGNTKAVDTGAGGLNIAAQRTGHAHNFKINANDINGIRNSHTKWGAAAGYTPEGDVTSFWTTTPGSGAGLYGAEIFHRQDCTYDAGRTSSAIKQTNCRLNRWTYAKTGQWYSGGHWWDNSGCYAGWYGYHNEGHHGTGNKCYNDGRGLGYHCGGHAPFHRGWCGTSAWGQEYVR